MKAVDAPRIVIATGWLERTVEEVYALYDKAIALAKEAP